MWTIKHRLCEEANPDGAAGGGGNESGASPDWFTAEQKDFVANKGWKAPADAITSFQNLEKMVGLDKAGRTVVWPKDENDADGWKTVYSKLGVPEDPSGYKIPDAMKEDPLISKFAEVAHAAHLTPAGFEQIVTQMQKVASEMDAAEKAQSKEASVKELEKLKAEWGNDFDQNSEFARRFLLEAGWDDARIAKYEETFGTAAMLKDFHQWGSKMGEAPFVQGDGKGGMTPQKQAVQKQIDSLKEQRKAGTVSQAQYLAEMARLGPQLEAAA